MKILLDANSVYADYQLDSAPFQTFEKYLSMTDDELIVPQVVIEEGVRQFREAYEKATAKLDGASRILRVVDVELNEIPDAETAEDIYRENLLSRLSELSARILELPQVPIVDLLERDMSGRRPFDRSGKGFRDTLIWEALIKDCLKHDETIVMISSDGDFAEDSKDREHSELHPDLIADLVTAGLDVERIEIIRNIYEFNEIYAKPLITRVYKKGEPIDDSFAAVLDPTHILALYGEAAAREVHERLPFILPIGCALADRVSFIRWPENPELLEALDLGDGMIQATIRTAIVFDTDIYGPEPVFPQIMDFSKGRPMFPLNTQWNEINQEYVISLRAYILADFVFLWHTEEGKASGVALLRYGFSEDEIEKAPISLH